MVEARRSKCRRCRLRRSAKPKRREEEAAPKATPAPEPPVQVASVTPPPIAGGDGDRGADGGRGASPQTKQEAADLIASNEKRLKALPPQKAEDAEGADQQGEEFSAAGAGGAEVRRCGGSEDAGDQGEAAAG